MRQGNKRRVLVIGGPTGVGESTVTKAIIKKYPIFKRLVTATTRQPRLKEKNGVDYYFFSVNNFRMEIKKGNIIEHTYIKERDVYYGSYGPDLEEKFNKGFNIIVNPDIVGAKYFKKNYRAITIFIMPDSLANLKKRQLARNPKIDKEELKKRLEYAKYEIDKEALFYDYQIVNKQNKLKETINQVVKIVKENF